MGPRRDVAKDDGDVGAVLDEYLEDLGVYAERAPGLRPADPYRLAVQRGGSALRRRGDIDLAIAQRNVKMGTRGATRDYQIAMDVSA